MSRLRGTMRIQGLDKNSDLVYVKRGGEYYSRRRPQAGAHKDDKVLMGNANAAEAVNGPASVPDNVFKYYADGFLKRCYTRMLSLFFKADHAARIVRLSKLKGFDGHPITTLSGIIRDYNTQVITAKNKITVTPDVNRHAKLEKELKYYYMQFILVLWDKKGDCSHEEKHTKWIEKTTKLPLSYDFEFAKPAGTTDYLLMCCCVRGEEKKEERLPPERTLQVIGAGSFDKHALAILAKHQPEEKPFHKKEAKSFMKDDEGVGPIER